jgi:hypothetical protein
MFSGDSLSATSMLSPPSLPAARFRRDGGPEYIILLERAALGQADSPPLQHIIMESSLAKTRFHKNVSEPFF